MTVSSTDRDFEATTLKPWARGARLLFLIDDDSYFCSHRLELGRMAQESGFRVSVATRVQEHGKAIEEAGFRLHPIALRRGFQSPWRDLAALRELIRLYRTERPDLVHHVSLKQMLFGSIAARIAGVPAQINAVTGLGFLFQADGFKTRVVRTAVKWALRWGLAKPRATVIFQNTDDREHFTKQRLVTADRTVLIRGAGVNVAEFHPVPEPDGIPVVLFPARMLLTKGLGEFIEAARRLRAQGIAARFVLAGGTDEDNPSTVDRAQLETWQQEGLVEWCGHQSRMAPVLQGAHIVVLPSYTEGLPKVLLEAAACGRAIVATDIPGSREVVRHGENGLLVPVKDSTALAAAIERLIVDPALRRCMGERGRAIVVSEFTSQRVARETVAVYRRTLVPTSRMRGPNLALEMIRRRPRMMRNGTPRRPS